MFELLMKMAHALGLTWMLENLPDLPEKSVLYVYDNDFEENPGIPKGKRITITIKMEDNDAQA